jgi:hypothetical protein
VITTPPVPAAHDGSLTAVRTKRSVLAFVSCFFSLSALLMIVGAAPLSVLGAPLGIIGGVVSLARIRSAPIKPAGRGMAISAIAIGAVAFPLSLIVLLGTRAS